MKNGDFEIIKGEMYNDKYGIVLGHDKKAKITPWVTWEYEPTRNSFFWGHYFGQLQDALQDYHLRLYRNLGGYEK